MIRFTPSTNARGGYFYFSKSDSGFDADELAKEVGGKAAAMLGVNTEPDFEQFKRLLHGLDPHTGEQLTAKLIKTRISYWDVTASVPKGVTVAIENGDERVREALWQAGRETMADLEAMITTRVRKAGAQENRLTQNCSWYAFEHHETRPAKSDGMPDPDRHIHFVIPNVTFDPQEQQWKAIKFRPLMDLRKWFDRRFDMRMASKLTELGYEVETKYKPDPKGGQKYFSWDIKGMPESALKKYSRRTQEVDEREQEILQHLKEEADIELDRLSPRTRDSLGEMRQHKRKDKTLAEYRDYWQAKLTDGERRQIASVIADAQGGRNPEPANTAEKAVAFAIGHIFERRSVCAQKDLEIAAMERAMGAARPEDILPEMLNQGVLLKDGKASTRAVLAEETRIIEWARVTRATMPPLADARAFSLKNSDGQTLSAEQLALVRHVLGSTDQCVLCIGDAGTGKTHAIKTAFAAIKRPVEMLAPSADASRGVLRQSGFEQADTVRSFLDSPERQAAVQDGVIWVDEVSLLPIRDLSALMEVARERNARLVLQGDNKQHASPARTGNMMQVLQDYAGLKPGRLTETWRFLSKAYKHAVGLLAQRKAEQALDKLIEMGWVTQTQGDAPLIDDYMAGLNSGRTQLIIAPTHAHGERITEQLRERLKLDGLLGMEDKEFDRLVPLNWTEAERAATDRYSGEETLVFHRNSGSFKAGDRIRVRDWKKGMRYASAAHFSVYRPGKIALAAGDVIRATASIKDAEGRRIDNGTLLTVTGFAGGRIQAASASGITHTLKADVGMIAHGLVSTSHASQGRTVDSVLVAMDSRSLPALSSEQFYVSISRGRHSARVYSDLTPQELKEAILKTDDRISATELLRPRPIAADPLQATLKKARRRFHRLRDMAAGAAREMTKHKGQEHAYER